MNIRIPETPKKRLVVVGGGFAGLTLLNKIDSRYFQIVLIDKNNYHQFQPLLYQVASSGLGPDSISFPFRKLFHRKKDFHFRMTEVLSVDQEKNKITTTIGELSYDFLVLAGGTTTNYFGNAIIQENAFPMKDVKEAINLRSYILLNLERALSNVSPEEREALLNIVVVGGGATGVEVAGVLAEMKRFIIPKDYPDLQGQLGIFLIEGTQHLLGNMSSQSSFHAERYLKKMGVQLILNTMVTGYEENNVLFNNGNAIPTRNLI